MIALELRTADMVAVLVGDENRRELPGFHAGLLQAQRELARRHAAVDQQAAGMQALGGLHQRGIAGAAAAQALETDGHEIGKTSEEQSMPEMATARLRSGGRLWLWRDARIRSALKRHRVR